jgi:hypothetical protein
MELKIACKNILDQVGKIIEQIDNTTFSKPSVNLNGATLGQHFRHAIEFFQCLEMGSANGQVCYDNRSHDINIETDKQAALEVIYALDAFIDSVQLAQPLSLEISYAKSGDDSVTLPTNMAREIVYNIEHLVHHMALVKIGIKELCPQIALPEDFGVAVSTIKYHNSLV